MNNMIPISVERPGYMLDECARKNKKINLNVDVNGAIYGSETINGKQCSIPEYANTMLSHHYRHPWDGVEKMSFNEFMKKKHPGKEFGKIGKPIVRNFINYLEQKKHELYPQAKDTFEKITSVLKKSLFYPSAA